MSGAKDYLTDSYPTWLQPVSYDQDGFRRFAHQLGMCLVELEQRFASRHNAPLVREDIVEPTAKLGESQLPST